MISELRSQNSARRRDTIQSHDSKYERDPLHEVATGKTSTPLIYLTDMLADQTAELLDSYINRKPSESVVYWLGLDCGPWAVVTTLLISDEIAGFTPTAARRLTGGATMPLVMLGQARSRPGNNVSPPLKGGNIGWTAAQDDELEGRLAVVVPYCGRQGLKLESCGFYRQVKGEMRKIEAGQLHEHVRIVKGYADLRAASDDMTVGSSLDNIDEI